MTPRSYLARLRAFSTKAHLILFMSVLEGLGIGGFRLLSGDFGFVLVFAGVILFYAAAFLLEQRFFLR